MRQLIVIFLCCCAFQGWSQAWKELYDSASVSWDQQDWLHTIEYLERAEKVARSDLGIYDANYFTILNDLGLAHLNAGHFQDARTLLHKTLSLKQDILPEDDPAFLESFTTYAMVIARENPEEAIRLYREYARMRPDLSPFASLKIGELFHDSGFPDSAQYYYTQHWGDGPSGVRLERVQKQVQLWLESGKIHRADSLADLWLAGLSEQDTRWKARALREKGLILTELGRYEEAERHLVRASSLFPNGEWPVDLLNAMSVLYARMGLLHRAVKLEEQAVEKAAAQGEDFLTLKMNLATLYEQTGRYEDAFVLLNDLQNQPKTPYQTVQLLMETARVARHLLRNQLSDSLFAAARLINEKEHLPDPLKSVLFANTGYAALQKGKIQEAAELLQEAYDLKSSIYGAESIQLIELKNNLGLVRFALGEEKEGLQLLSEALEGIRRQIHYIFPVMTRKEKIRYYTHLDNVFNRFNSLVVFSSNQSDEMVRAMFDKQLLVKGLMMRSNASERRECGSDSLRRLLQDYRFRLATSYRNATLFGKSEDSQTITELEQAVNVLEGKLTEACPAAIPVQTTSGWREVRDALKPGEALVDIIRVKDFRTSLLPESFRMGFSERVDYVAMVLLPEGSPQIVRFEDGAALESKYINYYLNAVRYDIYDTLSYKRYWEPLEERLAASQRIYWINDGIFHKLNLAGLRRGDGKYLTELKDIRLLINPADIYSPPKSEISKTAFLLGDPLQAEIDARGGTYRLSRLPEARNEILALADSFRAAGWSVEQFLDSAASRDAFVNYGSAGVLHLATHGFFSEDLVPDDSEVADIGLLASGLVFSPAASGEFLLTAYEIQDLSMENTDLVVLSACETGLGNVRNGEGIDGLQRAFISNGAGSVMISLWQVEDRSTRIFMQAFYTHYLAGSDKQTALQTARKELIDQGFTPKSWSAFVMVQR